MARTLIGERYFKIIRQYRYLLYAISAMLASSFANYLLNDNPMAKYTALALIYLLSVIGFRREIGILWNVAVHGVKSLLIRKKPEPSAKEDDHA